MTWGIVFRVLAIALGIMSATIMARDGFHVPLNAVIDNVINIYNGALEQAALLFLEPAIRAFFAKLREWFAIDLQLFPHWRHAVVMLWLLFGAMARAGAADRPIAPRRSFLEVFSWLWAGFCAVGGGVLTGIVPLSHVGAFLWPLVSCLLHDMGLDVWCNRFDSFDHKLRAWKFTHGFLSEMMLEFFGPAALGAGLGFFAISSPSPGLLSLVLFVGLFAVLLLLRSARDAIRHRYVPKAWLEQSGARVGIDVLSVLGGATFVVWLGNTLT